MFTNLKYSTYEHIPGGGQVGSLVTPGLPQEAGTHVGLGPRGHLGALGPLRGVEVPRGGGRLQLEDVRVLGDDGARDLGSEMIIIDN